LFAAPVAQRVESTVLKKAANRILLMRYRQVTDAKPARHSAPNS
jgi:hypothetical protein